MLLKINMASVIPIYQQIRDQIVLGIATGELVQDELLPTVRQLADDIGVNMMTVSKAYTLLKEQGYIETDRRTGSKVSRSVSQVDDKFQVDFDRNFSLLLAEAWLHGCSEETIHQMCSEQYAIFTKQKGESE